MTDSTDHDPIGWAGAGKPEQIISEISLMLDGLWQNPMTTPTMMFMPAWLRRRLVRASMTKRQYRRWRGRQKGMVA